MCHLPHFFIRTTYPILFYVFSRISHSSHFSFPFRCGEQFSLGSTGRQRNSGRFNPGAMLITRGFSLTNFVIGSSALCFQIFVLYPWHEKLEEHFNEMTKSHQTMLQETTRRHKQELAGIRAELEKLTKEKERRGRFW
ncbi:unnamed protein product [Periconia digitata]|uniref:Uncharacterized protein n=1 Tax=Periconia digitata TaxID=1303443 RepID=A0A9W4XR09_9PLEO|nr:unnamed protein product [Periconia digitata]